VAGMRVAIVKRPLKEPHCGDQAAAWKSGQKTTLCMIDGLGHGKWAEKAAIAALDFIKWRRSKPLPEIFAGCDKALYKTRGVAMGIAVVDAAAGTLTYAGIGNTRAMIAGTDPDGGRTHRFSSNYGIIGGGYKTLTPETMPFEAGDLLIMYTDGLPELVDMAKYDGDFRADPDRLAERILADYGRKTDDAAVLVFLIGE